jgi:hypothetical protein
VKTSGVKGDAKRRWTLRLDWLHSRDTLAHLALFAYGEYITVIYNKICSTSKNGGLYRTVELLRTANLELSLLRSLNISIPCLAS